MMAVIFGISASQLFTAIAAVESENGRTSDNVYQIRRVYLDDLGRIYGCHFADEVATDRHASEQVMLAYPKRHRDDLGQQPKTNERTQHD